MVWGGQAEHVVGRSAWSVSGCIHGAEWVGEGMWKGGGGGGTRPRDDTGPREVGANPPLCEIICDFVRFHSREGHKGGTNHFFTSDYS